MRPVPLLLGLLLVIPLSLAQGGTVGDGPVATLDIEVQDDRTERMTLTFDGVKPNTRYEGICLPERAQESRVYDDAGELAYEGSSASGRRALSFIAKSTKVVVDMTREGPASTDHPLYAGDANFCVPSSASVVVRVMVPADHSLFFMSDGVVSGRTGTTRAEGPTHVFYSYETPVGDADMALIDEPPFRVFVPTARAKEAEEVARLSAAPIRAALDEAGIEMPFDAMRVLFTPQTPFAWEAGHYNGHGYVQVKEDTLVPDATQGYPISAARVLVHEAFHGATFPYGKGSVEDTVAWWLEGTAKHSERQVDAAMPNATRFCEKNAAEVRCWDFDDRIKLEDVHSAYAPTFAFEADWEPSQPQSDDKRHFYYGYSEYVVAAWIARHGVEDYRLAWDGILAAFGSGEGCPCAEGWLEGILDDPDLFRPWRDVREATPSEFEALVKPFVKDEEALQRELARQANPFSSLPSPAWVALAAILLAGFALGRRD